MAARKTKGDSAKAGKGRGQKPKLIEGELSKEELSNVTGGTTTTSKKTTKTSKA